MNTHKIGDIVEKIYHYGSGSYEYDTGGRSCVDTYSSKMIVRSKVIGINDDGSLQLKQIDVDWG